MKKSELKQIIKEEIPHESLNNNMDYNEKFRAFILNENKEDISKIIVTTVGYSDRIYSIEAFDSNDISLDKFRGRNAQDTMLEKYGKSLGDFEQEGVKIEYNEFDPS